MIGNSISTSELKGQQTDVALVNSCGECSLEAGKGGRSPAIDRTFGLILAWTGAMALESLRVYANAGEDDRFEGECPGDDATTTSIRADGCSEGAEPVFPFYTAEGTAEATCPAGLFGEAVEAVATAKSIVSQRDAQRKADGAARLLAEGAVVCGRGGMLTDENDTALTE